MRMWLQGFGNWARNILKENTVKEAELDFKNKRICVKTDYKT